MFSLLHFFSNFINLAVVTSCGSSDVSRRHKHASGKDMGRGWIRLVRSGLRRCVSVRSGGSMERGWIRLMRSGLRQNVSSRAIEVFETHDA